jgi:hypothetical protein
MLLITLALLVYSKQISNFTDLNTCFWGNSTACSGPATRCILSTSYTSYTTTAASGGRCDSYNSNTACMTTSLAGTSQKFKCGKGYPTNIGIRVIEFYGSTCPPPPWNSSTLYYVATYLPGCTRTSRIPSATGKYYSTYVSPDYKSCSVSFCNMSDCSECYTPFYWTNLSGTCNGGYILECGPPNVTSTLPEFDTSNYAPYVLPSYCSANTGCTADLINNSICELKCYVPECSWDGDDCHTIAKGCPLQCPKGALGNGVCNAVCNVSECFYDLGECDNVPANCLRTVCPPAWINDSTCDPACNISECNFDGGDCAGTGSFASLLAFSFLALLL